MADPALELVAVARQADRNIAQGEAVSRADQDSARWAMRESNYTTSPPLEYTKSV